MLSHQNWTRQIDETKAKLKKQITSNSIKTKENTPTTYKNHTRWKWKIKENKNQAKMTKQLNKNKQTKTKWNKTKTRQNKTSQHKTKKHKQKN